MPKDTFYNLPEKKRQRIIDAAYEEYLNKPYEKVTVRSINARADIPTGCFYKYFDDKDELYLYLWQEITDKLHEKFSIFTDFIASPPELNAKEFLTEREIKFMATIYSIPLEVARRFYFGYNKDMIIEKYVKELKRHKDNNRLREGVDIQFTAFMYATTLYNLLIYFRENDITDNDARWEIQKGLYYGNFPYGILNKKVELPYSD